MPAMVHAVYVTDRFEETVAAYERLGFERVLAGSSRGALFRAGPAYVEVVDAGSASPERGERDLDSPDALPVRRLPLGAR